MHSYKELSLIALFSHASLDRVIWLLFSHYGSPFFFYFARRETPWRKIHVLVAASASCGIQGLYIPSNSCTYDICGCSYQCRLYRPADRQRDSGERSHLLRILLLLLLLLPFPLPSLLHLKLDNLLLDTLMQPGLQFGPIPHRKENLHPHKQGRQQQRLDQVIQQCGGPLLKGSVPNELGNPRYDKESSRNVIRHPAVGRIQVIGTCGSSDEERGQKTPGHRFQEEVEQGVDQGAYRGEVEGEVLDLDGGWDGE